MIREGTNSRSQGRLSQEVGFTRLDMRGSSTVLKNLNKLLVEYSQFKTIQSEICFLR